MTEQREGARTLSDLLGAMLSNPAVIEGVIAGISAISASRRTKSGVGNGGQQQEGGSLLDALPGILPLLSVISQPQTENNVGDVEQAQSVSAEPESLQPPDGENEFSSLFSSSSGADEGTVGDSEPSRETFADGVSVSYESREAQRENLLLAIRPFLSDSRRSAADAMVQVNKLSGLFRRR